MDVFSVYLCTAILAALGFFAQPFFQTAQHFFSQKVAPITNLYASGAPSQNLSSIVTFPACYESNHPLYFAHPVQFKSGPIQHSIGHVSCPACEAARQEAMQETELGRLPFRAAAKVWLENHKPYIAERTVEDYEQYISTLDMFFGPQTLNTITIGGIREYHKWRLQSAGASRTRMESSTLRQIMREAGCWTEEIDKLYKHPPLTQREKDGAGQSFTEEQEQAFFRVALTIWRCELVAHCSRVMFRTGCGFGELRKVKRGDLDLDSRRLRIVQGAKNSTRVRFVPLTDSASESAKWLLERWEDLGGTSDDEYLLPYRGADFSRPMVSIQNGWNKVISKCVKMKLFPEGFKRRVYDCRVTVETRLLSTGVPPQTCTKLLGHKPSSRMVERYYKPEDDILREALGNLEPKRKGIGKLRLVYSAEKTPSA